MPSPHRDEGYAEDTAAAIDEEVRAIVQSALNRAMVVLGEKRDVLERSAHKLLEKETLDEKDLAELIGAPPRSPLQVAAE